MLEPTPEESLRQKVLATIRQAAREKWKKLDLSKWGISELPEEIGTLTQLMSLVLNSNQLTALPESIGNLTELWSLDIHSNHLRALPSSIGKLTNLQSLSLVNNHLTELPETIGNLTDLLSFYVGTNQLAALPNSLARLENLVYLDLSGNPLNPALQSAYGQGLPALRAYLRSLEKEAEPLYEAKLVLVGEGGVGKTTLLKALTGQEPRMDEPTTHGVKIERQAMHIPHPEKPEVKIQLNAWDFGGQEMYRVTHQFFFSRRSIYLLVWEPRKGVQASLVEDWLRIIRLRVGDDARVIIISTHCKTGERTARIDKPVLLRDFGSMIVGFHEVDSLVDDPATGQKVGIAELKQMIAGAARDLEQMGMPFNRDWRAARDELLAMLEPSIAYAKLADVCLTHGLDEIATKTLATLMHDLGYIVYYGDDERLKNDVVLQPEWLTKAIGFVLEDRKTQGMEGILPDHRLKEVWWDHPFKGEQKYEPTLYPFFLRLMEKYDVLYRLEQGNASLIAQHVPQVRPALPWLADEEPTPGNRRIALVCAMEDAPPGLVPWMIVRTHDYAYDLMGHRSHWQKGMFLQNQPHGEALLELREREFHIYAQALWPEFFMNVLRKTLQKLITDNWPGMEGRYFFAVRCKNRINGKACEGRFRIDALRRFLRDGDETIRCQTCLKRQNIRELLYGFEEMDLGEQMRAIEAKQDGLDSRIANYVFTVMQATARESKQGPRLFTITPMDADWKKKLFARRYRLHLWCEADGCQHPVQETDENTGTYEFDASRDWVTRIAPYANFVAGIISTILPVSVPAAKLFFKEHYQSDFKDAALETEFSVMKEVAGKLLGETKPSDAAPLREGGLDEMHRSGILALHTLLRTLAPNHANLGLKRIPTYTGDFRWLCEKHYAQAQPKIPEVIGAERGLDTLLIHNKEETPYLYKLQNLMRQRGIICKSSERLDLSPDELQSQAAQVGTTCSTVILLIGERGLSPWNQEQLSEYVRELGSHNTHIVSVLLPNAPIDFEFPEPLRQIGNINLARGFRKANLDKLETLITGSVPSYSKGLTWIDWLEGEGDDEAYSDFEPNESNYAVVPSAIRLRNIRSFKDTGTLRLSTRNRGDGANPSNTLLILGDNASGKSTILHCIALASLGSERANLAEERAEAMLRQGEQEGFIEVLFDLRETSELNPVPGDSFCVGLKIQKGQNSYLPADDKDLTLGTRNSIHRLNALRRRSKDSFGFLCGYGAWRTMAGDKETQASRFTIATVDRVKSLFDPNYTLMDPDDLMKMLRGDLSFLRSDSLVTLDKNLRDRLEAHLTQLLPGVDGLDAQSASSVSIYGTPVPVRALSDGYSSLLAIIGHLFQSALSESDWRRDPNESSGVLLIDEVDLHLHPAWQRIVLPSLGRIYRNMFIIATSHSPMVASSIPSDSVRILRYRHGDSQVIQDVESIRGWSADQILTSVLFDLPTTRDIETEGLLAAYAEKLNIHGPEHAEVRELGKRVSEILALPGEGVVDQETHNLLNELLRQKFAALSPEIRKLVLAKAGLAIAR